MNKLTFWRRLRRLQKARSALRRAYGRELRSLRRDGADREQIHLAGSDYGHEDSLYEEQIHDLWTQYLREQAERLILPLPEKDDNAHWVECLHLGGSVLSTTGIDTARKLIRDEQRERRSEWLRWLSAFTGVIGAMSGLVAIVGHTF